MAEVNQGVSAARCRECGGTGNHFFADHEPVYEPSAAIVDRPACADECSAVLRKFWEETCMEMYGETIDAVITWLPPVVPSGFVPLGMSCPHGVAWYMEPTSEQVAAWARAGVE